MIHWSGRLLACAALGSTPAAAPAHATAWKGYPVIMWQDQTPAAWDALGRIGVTAGRVLATRDDAAPIARAPEPFASGMAFYVENIATDFYAAYHRWTPDHPADHAFDQERAAPTFRRSPSLSDAAWLARIEARLVRTVRAYAPLKPLYYSLGDETGIADLAAFWDFDTSDPSIAGFQGWLRGRYASLDALDAEWGSEHASWDDVRPELTDAAMARADENYSAWSDFKEWMDEAFARAVRAGTDAVHAADPAALAAIEGAQIPGWGGYDYTRLAPSVDLMEMYDFGESVATARAFNPDLVVLETASALDAPSRHAIWRALLRGARGLILWDEARRIVEPDGSDGPFAAEARALLPQLTQAASRLAGLREPESPVAVLYSPASLRAQWMLDRRPKGAAWRERQAETEYEDNPARAAFVAAVEVLQHLGLRPHIVSPETLASGALAAHGDRLLILPRAYAISQAEADAIALFQAGGGAVLADGPAGAFDGRLRKLSAPSTDASGFRRIDSADPDYAIDLGLAVRDAGVVPPAYVASRDAEVRVFADGADMVVAVQRDRGSADGERTLVLPGPAAVTDLATGETMRAAPSVTLTLDAVRPAFLRVSSGGG